MGGSGDRYIIRPLPVEHEPRLFLCVVAPRSAHWRRNTSQLLQALSAELVPLLEVSDGAADAPELSFSDSELLSLLGGPDVLSLLQPDEDEDAEAPAPSEELPALSRRLAGQYVDVLADFVRASFRQPALPPAGPLRAVLSPLLRLTGDTGADDMHALLRELEGLLERPVGEERWARVRHLRALRGWLMRFSECLDDDDGARLRQLVDYGDALPPLLEALKEVRGIGPRRIERLYCAGLTSVSRVTAADAESIAEVTGIPRQLAAAVVEAAQAFERTERARRIAELRRSIMAFTHALETLNAHDDPDMISAAQESLSRLQAAITQSGDS